MDRYQHFRQRFIDNFFFEGRVASHVSPGTNGTSIKFADQTIYLGQALVAFSSEVAVNKRFHRGDSDAELIISELLSCFEQLEKMAISRYDHGGILEGFFVRDDIVGLGDPRLPSRFLEVESDWQFPERENDTPSIDQIIGLMTGLLSVVRFTDDHSLADKARSISSRLFKYARHNNFVLQLPSGKHTSRGWDGRAFASLLHGLNKEITGEDHFDNCFIIPFPLIPIRQGLRPLAAFWDSPLSAQAITTLTSEDLNIPLTDITLPRKGYVIHMILMLLASSEVWSQQELEVLALGSFHHLAILLYAAYHSCLPRGVTKSAIDEILDSCPLHGPAQGIASSSGWQNDNRWVRCANIFEINTGQNSYNGIDWLALHNTSQLAFAL